MLATFRAPTGIRLSKNRGILGRLPEIVPKALPQTGYGQDRKSSRAEPNDWPKGFQLVWPLREKGLALVLRVESEANMVVSIFPFFAGGSQHTLTLSEVTVWESGVEAQITAIWGDGEVSFFDSQYSINRAWYETGRDYEFIFSGMAYNAAPAEKREWTIDQHPDQVAWMNRQIKDGEEPEPATRTLSLDGAAMFLPVSGWDIDDYSFHAPVKSVQKFEDWPARAAAPAPDRANSGAPVAPYLSHRRDTLMSDLHGEASWTDDHSSNASPR